MFIQKPYIQFNQHPNFQTKTGISLKIKRSNTRNLLFLFFPPKVAIPFYFSSPQTTQPQKITMLLKCLLLPLFSLQVQTILHPTLLFPIHFVPRVSCSFGFEAENCSRQLLYASELGFVLHLRFYGDGFKHVDCGNEGFLLLRAAHFNPFDVHWWRVFHVHV